jgi:phasin protein
MTTRIPSAIPAFSDFCAANVDAAENCAKVALDGTRDLIYAQMDALRGWFSAGGQQYSGLFTPGDPHAALSAWKQAVERNLDFASQVACTCLDTTSDLQDKLFHVIDKQMPEVRKNAHAVISSAWLPEETETGPEHGEDVARRKGRKAAA